MKGKKLLAGILSAMMALGAMALPAFADDGNGTQSNPYTLAEFNELTDVSGKELWVNLGDLNISETSTTLGNYNMSDAYKWVKDGENAPEGFTATTRRDELHNLTAYVTDKAGATIHITGTLQAKNGAENINDHTNLQCLYFQLPANSTVILESMTLNGVFDLVGSYIYYYNMPDGSIAHLLPDADKPAWATNVWYDFPFLINKIKINNCTINGQWFHNGASFKNISIDKTEFTSSSNGGTYSNTANPIWWQNMPGVESVSITNSQVTSTRPIKFESSSTDGEVIFTVTNNTFYMEVGDKYTGVESDKKKNTALILDIQKNLGNVDISDNKLVTAPGVRTQLIGIPHPDKMLLKEDKKFNISNNIKADGTALALTELVNGWKTDANAEWTEDLSNFLSNQQVTLITWVFDTDAGFYKTADGKKYGMMRFMFSVVPNGTVTEAGIKYVNADNLSAEATAENTVSASGEIKAFQGDIVGISTDVAGGGAYYALAYVKTEKGEFWSNPVRCSVDWTQYFTDYTPGGAN